ncbi:conserved repeat protein (List_Bact_rpt) [Sphaerochaeta pleomorpha str. Grapes]|uniref:Conserved repeat protein (List_Bact_rpt) n=1 Tax=Sphaerochaeta pleomorpha (strain ATCC BAA-1885 / DSM 22778 / Grapes) TaxID=158190 RepID=G8QWX1_SPHPG|nr:InlB B-repeat-containing protein [Sphaerochaeta pleomorpha]AEV29475.1 conserved repeat protein (List_Bact_rpt) [Sphaerochaeta pleomorpha str. Grapes]
MSQKKNILLVVVLCVLALFIGCEPANPQIPSEETPNIETPDEESPKQGILTVTLEKEEEIPSSLEAEIVSYTLSGIGPEGKGFSGITSQYEAVTLDLCCGTWTITAIGLNSDNQPVGEGVATVSIQPDTMHSTTITVEGFVEEGLFALHVSWPPAALTDPQVSLSLCKEGSDTEQDLAATIDTVQGKTEFQKTLPVGDYTLLITLSDGSPNENNPLVVKRRQAFSVESNTTTEGACKASWEEGYLQGTLSFPAQTSASFAASLFSRTKKVSEGMDVQFIVTTDPEFEVTYTWYVDGEVVDETGKDLIYGSSLSRGYHTVDVIVSSSEAKVSQSSSLLVTEDVHGYMYFRLTSLDTPTDRYVLTYECGAIGSLFFLGQPELEGKGIPFVCKIVSTSGNISGLLFMATDVPALAQEGDLADYIANTSLFIPQDCVGDFEQVTQPGEDQIYRSAMLSLDFMGSSPTEHLSAFTTFPLHVSVTSCGNVGEKIRGSLVADSVEIWMDKEGAEEGTTSLGNYKVEGFFSVERITTIYFYILSYDSNGADSGTCNEPEDLFAGMKTLAQGYDSNDPLVKAGFTFGGWNTKADGSGVTYQENDPFTMPNEDTTLYAVWN